MFALLLPQLLGTGWRHKAVSTITGRVVDDLLAMDEGLCCGEGAAYVFVALRKRGTHDGPPIEPALVCPRCKTAFPKGLFACSVCGRDFPMVEGIPVPLSYAERIPWLRDYLAYHERRAPREYVT